MKNYVAALALRSALPGGSYLNSLPAVQWLAAGHTLAFTAPVTFLVGENGSGKSTLLEAIAVAAGFNVEGGTRNFCFSTQETQSELGAYVTLARREYPKDGFFLRAESFYNVASYIDRLDEGRGDLLHSYGGKSLHGQSHGESFLALAEHRFGGCGLYLLDEPEAALSPSRQMSFMALMDDLVKNRSQFIIATHSPILMAFPGAQIYLLNEEGISSAAYEETEHYQLTRRFLNDHERMLRYLLEE